MVIMGLDLGSNRIKYSIVDITTRTVLDSKSNYYALTKSLDNFGNIPIEKINETVDIINRYKEIAKKYYVSDIKAVATAGLRIAKNADQLINTVRERTGVNIEVISGAKEAKLNWVGALLSFTDENAQYVVIDIGGASTEISVGTKERPHYNRSIKIGSQLFTSQFNSSTRDITDSELNGMEHFLAELFRNVLVIYNSSNIYVLTGSSGVIVLQANDPSLIGPEDKWKRKPVWELSYDMVDKAVKKYQYDKTCDDPTLCFAQCFIVRFLMKKFNIPSINFSITTLKEGVALV